MKKTYFAPEIETVRLHAMQLMSTSDLGGGGDDSGNGTTESNSYQGGFLWNDTEEE